MKADVYQIVTDRIVAQLEKGVAPWRKPWAGGEAGMPRNFATKAAYRGVNIWMLHAAGYESPWWMSFKQAIDKGGNVKRGEHSPAIVMKFKLWEREDKLTGEIKKIPYFQYTPVFNASQIEGIEFPAVTKPSGEHTPIEAAERIVSGMPQRPEITHGGGRAFYRPSADSVTMPEAGTFSTPEEYYNTLFHELTHATGHSSRLSREGVTKATGFGSDPYAREELVAEMGASFLSGVAGIETVTLENSAAYLASWIRRLKEDSKLIVRAGSEASKAADFILGRVPATATPQGGASVPVAVAGDEEPVAEPEAVAVA